MENCCITFFRFYEEFVANEGVWPINSMLTEHFVTLSCCVLTYQNITSDTSTTSRYENVQEIRVG